jgi:hypothetical protein
MAARPCGLKRVEPVKGKCRIDICDIDFRFDLHFPVLGFPVPDLRSESVSARQIVDTKTESNFINIAVSEEKLSETLGCIVGALSIGHDIRIGQDVQAMMTDLLKHPGRPYGMMTEVLAKLYD